MTLPMLQEQPSALGSFVQGANVGMQQALPSIQEMIYAKQKRDMMANILNQGRQQSAAPNLSIHDESFKNLAMNIEQQTGQELTPQDLDFLWNNLQQSNPQQMQNQGLNITPEMVAQMAMIDPQQANVYAQLMASQQKKEATESERGFIPQKEYMEYSSKRNAEFLNKVDQISNDLPNTQYSIAMIEDALGNADKWAAAKDLLAEKTGYAGLRSAPGAELDSAIKNYFLGDLGSIKGGRINQFLEKQVRDAYMKAGQDPISNQKILLGMKMKENINRIMVDKSQELEEKFLNEKGYLPSNFQQIVKKEIKSEVDDFEKETIKQLHNLSKIEENRDKIYRSHVKPGETLMMSATGEPFAVKNKDVTKFREQGFIPLGKK